MAKLVLDHDPLSGQTVYFGFDEHTQQVTITHEQDVQANLDYAHELAIDEDRTKLGMRKDIWHYAHLPSSVIVEMKQKHGVDVFNQQDRKKMFRLLNTEYKRLKTTHKTHNG